MATFRLDDPGPKRIAVIKSVRDCYGFDLRTCKDMVFGAPVDLISAGVLPSKYEAMIGELRSHGSKLTCLDPSAIDKLAALQFMDSAQEALGDGEMDKVRSDLRAALKLLGDF